VTYSDNKSYYFAPWPLSRGSEDDVIVMPNLPLMGALRKMSGSDFAISMLESMLRSHAFGIDKNPFVVMSVREFLWGYPSLIMSMERAQVRRQVDILLTLLRAMVSLWLRQAHSPQL
jgi:hypothetical protein